MGCLENFFTNVHKNSQHTMQVATTPGTLETGSGPYHCIQNLEHSRCTGPATNSEQARSATAQHQTSIS